MVFLLPFIVPLRRFKRKWYYGIMHRVNAKKRQKLILRIVSYGIMTIATVITTALLLLVALGYRFDNSGEVVRSGLLLADSKPIAAQVNINGENKNDQTPSRFVLPAGKYTLSLVAEGYREWNKTVSLLASSVENIYYARLIPEELRVKALGEVSVPQLFSALPDRSGWLLYESGAAAPSLLQLDNDTYTTTSLPLPASFARSANGLGELTVVDWSLNSEFVLMQQRVNGQARILLLNIAQPGRSVDLTRVFGQNLPEKLEFDGERDDQLVGLFKQSLREYNVARGTSRELLARVQSYGVYSDEKVGFVRKNTTGTQYEAGVLSGSEATVVHKAPIAGGVSAVALAEYRDDMYLAVQLPAEKAVTLYRNPLKRPILSEQLPYSALRLKNAKKLSFSSNYQFLLAQNGSSLAVYDFEHARQYAPKLPSDASALQWLDSHHLLYKNKANQNFIMDFDGANRYELLQSRYGSVLFSENYEWLYRVHTAKNKVQLETAPLLVAS